MRHASLKVIAIFTCLLFSMQATGQTAISTEGIIESKSGGFKFPDGSIQTTAAPDLSANVSTLQQRLESLFGQSCASGYFISGFTAEGSIICNSAKVTDWAQLGGYIEPECVYYDLLGARDSLDLSEDGSRIIQGSFFSGYARVHEWNDTAWVQVGETIFGEGEFGNTAIISRDGQKIAVGDWQADTANGNASGLVKVYEWSDGSWTQLGSDILGAAANDNFGYLGLEFSANTMVLAVGALNNDDGGNSAGHVRVFDWTGLDWEQRGSSVPGGSINEQFGAGLSLSGNGNRWVAVALNGGSSLLRVYEWDDPLWRQVGSDVVPTSGGYPDGLIDTDNVALSDDGSLFMVGLPYQGSGFSGVARAYHLVGEDWQPLGDDINGEPGNNLGRYVDLSANGRRAVIAATEETSANPGKVMVFEYSGVDWVQLGTTIAGNPRIENVGEPFRFGAPVTISADGSTWAASNYGEDFACGPSFSYPDEGSVLVYRGVAE